MGKLCLYFGVVGIASIVAWGAALLLLAAFARSRRRTRAWLAALALSVLAFILAKVNSHNIGQFETDRSAEEAELRARRESAPAIAPTEKAGETKGRPLPATGSRAYAYREAGKQKRQEGAKLERPELAAVGEQAEASAARRLPEADVIAADRLDRLNLFAARWVPWLVLLMLCGDYLSCFNRTAGCIFPLPIAGRTIDALFPKTHSVLLRTPGPHATRRYLERVVRKGETFIYCGPADLWDAEELPRLHPVLGHNLWRLRKLLYGADGVPADPRFVFDSAWFGRYCFVVTDPEAAGTLVAQLVEYLDARRIPRAAAQRTVHVVWDLPPPLPVRSVQELASLCRETNFKLAVVADGARPQDWADAAPAFEEQCDLKGA